jgi:glutathione S-transferase
MTMSERPMMVANDARPLQVIGRIKSINVRKVLWSLDEIGAAYERLEPEPPVDLLSVNPRGLMPVLHHGDEILTESNTIVRYLARVFGRDDLLPTELGARARIEAVMDWQATDLNSAWRAAFLTLVRKRTDAGDAAQVQRSIDDWTRQMQLLDGHLAQTGPYICGATFTAADIVMGLGMNRWRRAPIAKPDLAAVRGYMTRLDARPCASRYIGIGSD